MLTIGTAGHIDHGKSSLVKALTEIDPDRLPEEKTRGMTLDLGFAWFKLPSGEKVGIIDVPGHEHFVRNVIPGMSGIDGVILLVAADDGWMPQTEEHMQIINLLGIKDCIIALNKVDLVADEEWLQLVEVDIAERLKGTSLEGSPIIRVSARERTGINELKEAVTNLVEKVKMGRDTGKPRLPIDRVFIIKGSGVVVTGTLHFGYLSSGDDVVVLPDNIPAHIRSIEAYKETSQRVEPGCRVALNLTGAKKEDLGRGDVIVPAGGDKSTSKIINTQVSILPGPGFVLKNGEEVLVYMETGEYLCRVTLMSGRELRGGEAGFVQLKLNCEAPVYIGQRLIIRRQSPADTIGGGVVLDPFASVFKTRHADTTINWLDRRKNLQVEELVLTELEKYRFLESKGLLSHSIYSRDTINAVVEKLVTQEILSLKAGYLFLMRDWQAKKDEMSQIIGLEHQKNPLKRGVTGTSAQVKIRLPREILIVLTEEMLSEGSIDRDGDWLTLPNFQPCLSSGQKAVAAQIMALFKANPFNPPTLKDLTGQFAGNEDVIYYLLDKGSLVQLSEGVLLGKETFDKIKVDVTAFLKTNGHLAIQDMNKLFGLSRKYSIPVLGQLDKEKVTRREGDVRVLG